MNWFGCRMRKCRSHVCHVVERLSPTGRHGILVDIIREYQYTSLCAATAGKLYRTFACRASTSILNV